MSLEVAIVSWWITDCVDVHLLVYCLSATKARHTTVVRHCHAGLTNAFSNRPDERFRDGSILPHVQVDDTGQCSVSAPFCVHTISFGSMVYTVRMIIVSFQSYDTRSPHVSHFVMARQLQRHL